MVNSRVKRITKQLDGIAAERARLDEIEAALEDELAEARKLAQGFQAIKELVRQF